MNRAFVEIEKDGEALYEGKASFLATVVDDYVEDIHVRLFAEPDFMDRTPIEKAATVARKDGEAYDVITAAAMNGSPLYVNGDEVDAEALRAEFPNVPTV